MSSISSNLSANEKSTNGAPEYSVVIIPSKSSGGLSAYISIAAREPMDMTGKTWTNGQVDNEGYAAKIYLAG